MNIDYSLFPNLDGNLGQIKVKIPDGINTRWPDGDALVENFIYKNGKISAIVDTKALIVNDSKTTIIPYDYFDVTFESIKEGDMTFIQGERCKYFTVSYVTDEDSNGEDDDGGSGSTPDSGDLTYTDLESLTLTSSEFIDTQMVPPADLLFRIDYQFNEDSPIDDSHLIMWFVGKEDLYETVGCQAYLISSDYTTVLHPAALAYSNWNMIAVDYKRHTMVRFPSSLATSIKAGNSCIYFEEGGQPYPQFGGMPFDYDSSIVNPLYNSFPLTPTLLFNSKGDNTISGCSITYYSIKLYSGSYDDSSLIADMRPVQASNGQKGLYCNVRKIFMPVQTATETAATTYSLRNNSPNIEEIIRMIAEEKGISLEA